MKSYPRIAAKLFCQPWCIMPEVLASLCDQFIARAAADSPVGPTYRDWETGQQVPYHPQVETGGGIALVRVHGVLGKHLDTMEMQCGGYDVALLVDQMANIADDPAIHTAILDFRSPGGIVMGIQSAAASITATRKAGKTCLAYTSEMCCSAAYWLASACDEIHAEPSAAVGSISTIVAGVDDSQQWAMQGKVRKVFATGTLKAMGMSGKPWTAEEETHLWEKVNAVDADFKGFIAEARGLTPNLMQGQWWHAAHAPAGVLDSTRFATLQSLIESVALAL
jgi:ClpP class serine protease